MSIIEAKPHISGGFNDKLQQKNSLFMKLYLQNQSEIENYFLQKLKSLHQHNNKLQ